MFNICEKVEMNTETSPGESAMNQIMYSPSLQLVVPYTLYGRHPLAFRKLQQMQHSCIYFLLCEMVYLYLHSEQLQESNSKSKLTSVLMDYCYVRQEYDLFLCKPAGFQ